MQLGGLRDPVAVRVLPQAQACEDGIAAVNHAVAVAARRRRVERGQRAEPVLRHADGRHTLRREVAEQLAPVVREAVAVAVEDEPRVVRVG